MVNNLDIQPGDKVNIEVKKPFPPVFLTNTCDNDRYFQAPYTWDGNNFIPEVGSAMVNGVKVELTKISLGLYMASHGFNGHLGKITKR